MNKFLVCANNSNDFKQTQENYAKSHNRETVTFRNSVTDTNHHKQSRNVLNIHEPP